MLSELKAVLRSPGQTLWRDNESSGHLGSVPRRATQTCHDLAGAIRRKHRFPAEHQRVALWAVQFRPSADPQVKRLEHAIADEATDLNPSDGAFNGHGCPGSAERPLFLSHLIAPLLMSQQEQLPCEPCSSPYWLTR